MEQTKFIVVLTIGLIAGALIFASGISIGRSTILDDVILNND